jgi:hypothetical protein
MTDRAERFGWLERPGDDFPFYKGEPAAISGGQWWLVMAAILAGFLVLTLSNPLLTGAFLGFVPIVAFFALPLAALKYVAPRGWTAIFRRLRLRDALVMAGFALINILVTGIAGAILISVIDTTVNPAIAGLAGQDTPARILFFAKSVPQLFGEEVLTILPFLALLTWLTGKRGVGRKRAIVIAWLSVAVLFAAVHLPTYGWNVIQVIGGVGVARLVLTLPYIMTKNILVCTGAHILSDWFLFGATMVLSGLAAGAGAGG